eukprot:3641342-Amphidinium_carterae.1
MTRSLMRRATRVGIRPQKRCGRKLWQLALQRMVCKRWFENSLILFNPHVHALLPQCSKRRRDEIAHLKQLYGDGVVEE